MSASQPGTSHTHLPYTDTTGIYTGLLYADTTTGESVNYYVNTSYMYSHKETIITSFITLFSFKVSFNGILFLS